MNILRLSTLSLTLAIVVMTLGYVNPASAGKPVKNCDPDEGPVHASCKDDGGGGGGGDTTTEVIGVHEHNGINPPTTAMLWAPTDVPTNADPANPEFNCLMTKNSGNSLSGKFPRHDLCATLMTSGDSLMDDIGVVVNVDRRGNITGVQVQGQDEIGADGIVYVSAMMEDVSVGINADGNMVIHVHADNVQLYECDTHVLKKKSNCINATGIFSLHDLVYSSQP